MNKIWFSKVGYMLSLIDSPHEAVIKWYKKAKINLLHKT